MVERIINGKMTGTEAFKDLYPFRSNFKDVNGFQMHYIDEGKGEPVLMVHGNPTWSFYYRNLVKDLSPAYRTIVPDHIGCGLSDKPSANNYNYTLENRINDLDCLIRQLDIGQKIHLVIHDWGGMIGLAWALKNLDRIGNIIITNTSGFFLPSDKKLPLRLWIMKYLSFFAIPAVLGFNLFSQGALYMCSERKLDKPVKKGLAAPYNSWKNRIATLKFVQDIPITDKDQSYSIVSFVDANLYRLKDFNIMLLWGIKDFVFDVTFLNEFQKRLPGVETHRFNDAGHYLFEDKPEKTSELIQNFLLR